MSKSLGNYVPLTQPPDKMFGQIMSIPDSLLGQYYKMLTELEPDEWQRVESLMESGKLHPMAVKKLLAGDIVAALHDPEAAADGRAHFERQFSARDYNSVADTLPTISVSGDVVTQLGTHRGESNSAIRRLMKQGGVQLITAEGDITKPKDLEELDEALTTPISFIRVGKTVLRAVEE
jgi:tyrosyl-tRNA synthetase